MYNSKAGAYIQGSSEYPEIYGEVVFQQMQSGVEVTAEIYNLPKFSRENGVFIGPFGFHAHDGAECGSGEAQNPFPETKGHYNPFNQPHGNHAGDFPVLMPTLEGTAYLKFFTDKFTVPDIIGKTVVIHLSPDDYRTEPAGNSGKKIACGKIGF